ncbi:hypothetical protein CRYPA_1240 [uncultured Candidatus Thioglobus sp.]|nr:hypothetical protein CRYPA_1240 [uncultured Candidatus Thioglobus sp.]
MNKTLIAIIVFVLAITPFVFWSLQFSSGDISNQTSDWSNFGSFVGGTLSPVLAFISFLGLLATLQSQEKENKRSKKHEESKIYCDHAINTIALSYNTLSDNGKSPVPIQDRLVWLTTARLILSAKSLYGSIPESESSLRRLYIGEEEFWRMAFYKLLDPHNPDSFSANQEYFINSKNRLSGEIEKRSIKVIYDFVECSDDTIDPMWDIEYYTPEEIEEMRVGQRGLKKFLLSKLQRRQ